MEIHTCTHGVEGMSLLIDRFELKAVEEESKCEKITRAFLLESRVRFLQKRCPVCVSRRLSLLCLKPHETCLVSCLSTVQAGP